MGSLRLSSQRFDFNVHRLSLSDDPVLATAFATAQVCVCVLYCMLELALRCLPRDGGLVLDVKWGMPCGALRGVSCMSARQLQTGLRGIVQLSTEAL